MTGAYVASRAVQSGFLVLLVITLAFVIMHVAPGDPVLYLYGGQAISEQTLEAIRHAWGLDKPLWNQYISYVLNIIHGNLGYSAITHQAVARIFAESIPNTLLLMIPSILIAAWGGVSLGTIAARYCGSLLDYTIGGFSLISYATPPFWSSVLFIIAFSSVLHWFPTQGMTTLGPHKEGVARALDIAWHMVLPVSVLAWWYSAVFARLARAAMIEELHKIYILTARMKGLSESRILYHHALRNALRPVVTVLGLQLGTMFAGAVMTEIVFAWPGMGRVIFAAILSHDYPLVLGVFLIVGCAVVVANFLTDLVYTLIDPRIRYA